MRVLAFLLMLLAVAAAEPVTLEVLFWNLESPGHANEPGTRVTADIDFLCERIERDFKGLDLAGFEEVDPQWPPRLEAALEKANPGRDYAVTFTARPEYDKILLAWDQGRFERLDGQGPPQEAPGIEGPFVSDMFRPAAFIRLKDRRSGVTLLFMGNHLARSKGEKGVDIRRKQAAMLRDWTLKQSEPVIMGGDFNFDLPLAGGDPEQGYSTLTFQDALRWARPATVVDTNAHGDVLDFIFTGNAAREWPFVGRTLESDYQPPERNSDHRPVWARFTLR